MFYAIATLLDDEVWDRILESNPRVRDLILGHRGPLDYAHFSWLVCEEIDREKTIRSLESIAGSITTFDVLSGGIGIFPGKIPAITYILARNEMLSHTQASIWSNCAENLGKVNVKYSPERWIPHITLLHYGLESREYCEFLETCIDSEVSFSINVNNLAIIYKDEDSAGLLYKCDLHR
jgi:2'-5' RNA ligase